MSMPVKMMPTMAWAKLGSLYEPTRKMSTNPAMVSSTPRDCRETQVMCYTNSQFMVGNPFHMPHPFQGIENVFCTQTLHIMHPTITLI